MAVIIVGLDPNSSVTFNAHTITIDPNTTEHVTWSPAHPGLTIHTVDFNVTTPLPNGGSPEQIGDFFRVDDSNTLESTDPPATFHYSVVVEAAGRLFTSQDPEIVNSPPVGGG